MGFSLVVAPPVSQSGSPTNGKRTDERTNERTNGQMTASSSSSMVGRAVSNTNSTLLIDLQCHENWDPVAAAVACVFVAVLVFIHAKWLNWE